MSTTVGKVAQGTFCERETAEEASRRLTEAGFDPRIDPVADGQQGCRKTLVWTPVEDRADEALQLLRSAGAEEAQITQHAVDDDEHGYPFAETKHTTPNQPR